MEKKVTDLMNMRIKSTGNGYHVLIPTAFVKHNLLQGGKKYHFVVYEVDDNDNSVTTPSKYSLGLSICDFIGIVDHES